MSFVVVEPGIFKTNRLPDEMAAVDKTGTLRARMELLEMMGIKDRAVVLADKDTGRLAVRAAKPGEKAYAVKQDRPGKGGTARINVSRALKACGVSPKQCGGRCEPMTKDDLLIVTISDVMTKATPAKGEKKPSTK